MTLRQMARRAYDEIRPNGITSLFRLRVIGPNKSHGVRHQSSDAGMFHGCLGLIHEDWRRFTFIDMGCGKGNALLLAKRYGFKHLIGVEFAPALAKVAQRRIPEADIVSMDAADYRFPSGPLLVYLYNPFDQTVLHKVVSRLPPCYVAYVNPRHSSVLQEAGFVHVAGSPDYSLWKREETDSAEGRSKMF